MPKHVACGLMYGDPGALTVPDIDRTDYLLMLGANPWESNGSLATAPDFRGRLKAIQARGGHFVVVDPRRTATAAHADRHLQIRPGTDALYDYKLEPWSEFLTGRQGRPPEPAWDPLAFAVSEAHKRGLELHAWFNPYRARYEKPLSDAARTHIIRTQPSLVRQYGSYLWMDPGDPAVRRRTVQVVADVVRRYDIDGVHIDDYFYPYRENDASARAIDFPDSVTYARYRKGGGTLSRDDWRRQNVDLLVEALYKGVHAVKPNVRFGVSPIGIWRPGNPPSVTPGFDAYQEIFADTRKWLRNGWLDYWVPQLYWAIDSPQSYPVLLDWWASQNVKHRHLWIGNGLHRVADPTQQPHPAPRSAWRADEIIQQVNLTRTSVGTAPNGGATGNVFFSMKGIMRGVDSIDAKLASLYADQALVPASTWLCVVRTLHDGQWSTEILPNEVHSHRLAAEPERVVVNAVDRVGNLSAPVVVRGPKASVAVGQ